MSVSLSRLRRKLKKLLRVQTESRQIYLPSVRSKTIKLLMLLVVSLSIGIWYPGEVLYDPLDMPRRGEIAPDDIVAPAQITVLKSQREVEAEQEQVRQFTVHVIDVDTTVADAAIRSLHLLSRMVTDFRSRDSIARFAEQPQFTDSVLRKFPNLSENAVRAALSDSLNAENVTGRLERILLEQIYRVGVLAGLDELPDSRNRSVLVRSGSKENIYERGRILDLPLAYARLLTVLNRLASTDSIDSETHYLIGRAFIIPNLTVNMDEYERRVEEELAELSNVKRIVKAGDVVVSARQKVTQSQEEILRELAHLLRGQASRSGWLLALLPVLARVLLVLATFFALYLFLYYFRSDIYKSNPKLLAIFLVFVLQMFFVYLVELLGLKSIYIYPVAILPIMITILFDAEVGVLSTIILALLLGIMHRFSFSLVLLTMMAGIVGSLTSRDVSKRSHFYRIMLSVVLGYLVLILVVENLKLTPNEDILTELLYGGSVGVFSVLVIVGLLPVFEFVFGITTDITLLELSDLNHPLLKRLSIEAPGTYHHSISVGNLSEAAAEEIGCNALLARVGAYYHDIGKIEIPEYFVENQFSVKSKHDSLTPSMSTLILSSHVKKGRLLGEDADIPDASSPDWNLSLMIFCIKLSILAGFGSSRVLLAASTASASIAIPVSLV